MIFRLHGIKGVLLLLLIAAFLLAGVGAWASHGCCGHPSGSARAEGYETADSETGTLPQDNDCISACCQTVTAISPVPHVTFAPDPLWFVAGTDAFAASRTDTDIYRPPIA